MLIKNLFKKLVLISSLVFMTMLFSSFFSTHFSYDYINSFAIENLPAEVYLGGRLIGMEMDADGVLVAGLGGVDSKESFNSPAEISGLKQGDIILSIGDNEVNTPHEIKKALNLSSNPGKEVLVIYKRNDDKKSTTLVPAFSESTRSYKLGAWVQNSVKGIGTLTYIDPASETFGALGHPLNDRYSGEIFPMGKGKLFTSYLVGVKKGVRGRAGQIQGVILNSNRNYLGDIVVNSESGVMGDISEIDLTGYEKVEVGGRGQAKPGKAKIVTYIFNGEKEEFDIEIIKTHFRNEGTDSFVYRVKDADLIAKTGGIVQGMSGSPILQNGKLIGAVTHVYVNDPTKGFGIYVDNMFNAYN